MRHFPFPVVWSFLIILFLKFFWLRQILTRDCVAVSNSNSQRLNVMFDIKSKAIFFFYVIFFAPILYPINPLRSSFLDICNLSTSLLGCSSFFIVITFLVFLSTSSRSFVRSFCPFYRTFTISHQRNSHVFIAMILFLPFPTTECTILD